VAESEGSAGPGRRENARGDQTLSALTRKLGRYELLTQIGKGGMAEVHLAVQRGPGGFEKLIVIKLMHEYLACQASFVDMLLDEGRLAGMIKHPNVVDIYDLGEADGRYFVAMEYLDGEPLLAILRRGADGERLDPLSTARVISDTAEGLEAAHRLKSLDGKPLGLIHHDVSLGNIVVLYSGVVKLVDFGVAKARVQGKTDQIQGKFAYMAPEKLTEGAEVDRRSDIWSLGVVAWEALTLRRLFKGSDPDTVRAVREQEILAPSSVCPEVPAELDPVILRALERDPEKRYSTAKAFALDLEDVLRKHGYAKNDKIAAYMRTAFAKQIEVRERLVAELASGRTSKETIEAFREAATMTLADGRPITAPAEAESSGATASADVDSSAAAHRDSIADIQQWLDDERRRRAQAWRRYLPYALGGLVLVIAVIVLASRSGHDRRARDRRAANVPDAALGSASAPMPAIDATPMTVAVDAPEQVAIVPPDAAVKPIEMPPADLSDPEPLPDAAPAKPPEPTKTQPVKTPDKTKRPDNRNARPKDPPPDKTPTSAAGLYRLGMSQLRRGDAQGALDSFTQATKVDASFAAAWYGIGRAHEALGTRRGPVKSAYLRYLSLDPRGAFAGDARARIEKL